MEEDSTDKIFAVIPPPPDFNPVKQAVARAEELGEKQIATTLGYFSTMPASTGIIANPVLHHTPVDCNGTTITLDIRSFTIRGTVPESDIVAGKVGPIEVIFTGLFGAAGDTKESRGFYRSKVFSESFRFIDRRCSGVCQKVSRARSGSRDTPFCDSRQSETRS